MMTTADEQKAANSLIEKFLENEHLLPYANTDDNNRYLGWVTDFRLRDVTGQKMHLDLLDHNDLFLLFVLAVVWSRTGPWENSAFFVSHLKIHEKHDPAYWREKENCDAEKALSELSARKILKLVTGIISRKQVSFREDIYDSVHVLAINWHQIIESLERSARENTFDLFIDHMRSIEGLGTGRNKMRIKIPLILRELRCQHIYPNISGAYCCVPDERVKQAAKELGIRLPGAATTVALKASSAKIYGLFGDLYDLPLFAYRDLVSIR